jgi:hypothetical protein
MSITPNVPASEPVAALPLEYEDNQEGSFARLTRAIASLLAGFGALQVIENGWGVSIFGRGYIFGQFWTFIWTYIVGLAVGLIQMFAGLVNYKSPSHLSAVWFWVWAAIIGNITQAILSTIFEIQMAIRSNNLHHQSFVFSFFSHLSETVSASDLALIVMILLIHRRGVLRSPVIK